MKVRRLLVIASVVILLALFVRGVWKGDFRGTKWMISFRDRVMQEWKDRKGERTDESGNGAEEGSGATPVEEYVIHNAWIVKGSGQAVRFLAGLSEQNAEENNRNESQDTTQGVSNIRTLQTVSPLQRELGDVVADLYVRDGMVYRIVQKPERISGRVLMIDRDAGKMKISGYETLPLAKEVQVYDLRGTSGSSSRMTGSENQVRQGATEQEGENQVGRGENEQTGQGEIDPEAEKITLGHWEQVVLGYEAADYVIANGEICAVLICREIQPEMIRVLIKTTGYSEYYHEEIELQILGEGEAVIDLPSSSEKKEAIRTLAAEKQLTFRKGCKYLQGGRCTLTSKDGIRVASIDRSQGNPVYQGKLEIVQTEQGLLLINEVSMEEYLRGVLPSEMPSVFPAEALQAQAICARSYAYRQLLAGGCAKYGAHVDDSVSYQVYQNISTTENTDAAIRMTEGQVLTWQGEPAFTSYFSSSCGVTAPAHKVWQGMDEIPYLMGGWQTISEFAQAEGDAEEFDLSNEAVFRSFIDRTQDFVDFVGIEDNVSWYRWETEISARELKKNIDSVLLSCYRRTPELVQTWQNGAFVSVPVDTVGNIKDIEILIREQEGLVTGLEITGDKNTIRVFGEYAVRQLLAPVGGSVLRQDGSEISGASMLPSAYMYLDKVQENGQLTSVSIHGGGYGHGVGMSQYGAKELAESGQNAGQILAHYYPGTEICSISSFYAAVWSEAAERTVAAAY